VGLFTAEEENEFSLRKIKKFIIGHPSVNFAKNEYRKLSPDR